MAKKWKHRTTTERAQRIVDAAKELHEACYDCWSTDDDVALRAAHSVMQDMWRITMEEGEEIEGWSGGTIGQSDVILAVLGVLRTYEACQRELPP